MTPGIHPVSGQPAHLCAIEAPDLQPVHLCASISREQVADRDNLGGAALPELHPFASKVTHLPSVCGVDLAFWQQPEAL
ncbi:hypothetical protein LMG28614_06271 [Paraburkholderia ultramafica]|uniref:Uncharacterized protein n=1 Tax=Paraburkholderia ultramafica TaxID=1544867 RepID=A0A6S7CC44_9BURK|nr:hypothetical protein [Paraburkholderia ultramafica]CAB3805944.1 hypothetical protein LMG28614_06271 [Paraburkholderia ultramafica]